VEERLSFFIFFFPLPFPSPSFFSLCADDGRPNFRSDVFDRFRGRFAAVRLMNRIFNSTLGFYPRRDKVKS